MGLLTGPWIYKRIAPKLLTVEADLPFVVPVLDFQKKQLRDKFGDSLQAKHLALPRLWIMAEDWKARLKTEEGVINVICKRGGTTDWNSIPALLEMMYKRDDREGLIACLVHDGGFASNDFSFEFMNCLFKQLMEWEGSSSWKAYSKWRGVSTPIARRAYDEGDPVYERNWWKLTLSDR